MTIDEAIKICVEDAEKIGGNPQSDRHAERCRQIVEWLMEYKDLKAEQNDQCVFIHELMSELKEAKQFLKAAVDDLKFESQCRNCKYQQTGLNNICNGCRGNKYEWRYANEALKLIES